MLKIAIPSTGTAKLTFSSFERYGIPAPLSGADAEINDDLVLNFEDEEEAVTYSEQLEALSGELEDETSPQNLAINDMIMAIQNDPFVQSRNDELEE
jgi:hypothetical protein